jgi:L-fuculose-phosphate aldolase
MSPTPEWELKQTIIEIGRRLWTKGYVASNDGNITVRIGEDEILTTPTGVSKGFMTPDMIIKMDMDGRVRSPGSKHRPSSEVKMHMEVYRLREDVRAVVHAHPPYCTSFAVAGIPLNRCVLPEAILTLGAVPIAPYGTPSTAEIPDSVKPYIERSDAVLLANHGALTLGVDLFTAYHRMETLEHSASIVFLAIQLGNVNIIPEDQVEKLMELREKMNIPGRIHLGAGNSKVAGRPAEEQVEALTRKVLERLKQIGEEGGKAH